MRVCRHLQYHGLSAAGQKRQPPLSPGTGQRAEGGNPHSGRRSRLPGVHPAGLGRGYDHLPEWKLQFSSAPGAGRNRADCTAGIYAGGQQGRADSEIPGQLQGRLCLFSHALPGGTGQWFV